MPDAPPPLSPPGSPVLTRIPPNTTLVRIHASRFEGRQFNPTVPTQISGGRFDSIVPEEPYLYAGFNLEVAVCEVLLRDIPALHHARRIPRAAIRGRSITYLKTTEEMFLVSLIGVGLSAIGQDPWLTSCDAHSYPMTRHWGYQIRRWAPDASGFIWRSRRNQEHFSCILYETACPPNLLRITTGFPADYGRGQDLIEAILNKHYVTLGSAI